MTTAKVTRHRRYEPTHPTEGPFPALEYTYDPATGTHIIGCECGDSCATTAELTARRFASSHTADHARLRIVTPADELEAAVE